MHEADLVLSGNWRAAAKLISRIECGDESVTPVLQRLYANGARLPVLGVTGPPGAGKSTIVDQLIGRCRASGHRVAVLAIDPSSPITGGAILGDRIRMAAHSADPGVFIRSMASRGRLGGLAAAVGNSLIVLDAMGVDRIVVETVGVGQSEIDISRHAQTILLVQTPTGGDHIQAIKAGLLDIGDVYAVNKADTVGADRMVSALRESVEFRCGRNGGESWQPPIIKTQAIDGTGVDELIDAIEAHRRHFVAHPEQLAQLLRSQARALLIEQVTEAMQNRYSQHGGELERLEGWLDEIIARRCHPYAAAWMLLHGREPGSIPIIQ
jgi:LAO/AO transport system kinase